MWKEENNQLTASFKFADFKSAFAFMTEIALHVEVLNHHPEWSNVYNTVEMKLTTHDEGNTITQKDRQLASIVEKVYKKYH